MSTRPANDPAVKQAARSTAYVILHNTSEVVTPDAEGREVLRFPKGAIVFRDGRVVEVGPAAELFARHPDARPHNANGRLVTPGLVDCHTHMIFGGNRAAELQMKLAGASYADIAAKGGGIRSTVRATSESKEEQLEKQLANRLERWRASGCTTVEVKSGYGLTPAREVRLLELMAGAAIRVPARVHRTALVLHALPEEYAGRREAYVAEVRGGLVDEIHRRGLAGTVDVFCDPVGFTVDECRSVLARAAELGFGLRLHAEQTARFGGARLAAELRARSADHLECADESDWRTLGEAGVVGVLLPAAALTLRLPLPEAQMLRRSGARVAVATDFNPGTAPAQSLIECAVLAARLCGLDAAEFLLAITWNAARALGVENEVGHLNPGACSDAVIWECESLDELPYWMPSVRPDTILIRGVDLALPAVERRVWP
jgi:imidazolonepropionase